MTGFCRPARVFEWFKGNRKDGEAKTKSKWVEKHYGAVNISNNQLSTADGKSVPNHRIQPLMNLKQAFNSERSWMYRLKGDDGAETTFAIRFKTKELAEEFQTRFVESVDAVKALEAETAKETESAQLESESDVSSIADSVEKNMDMEKSHSQRCVSLKSPPAEKPRVVDTDPAQAIKIPFEADVYEFDRTCLSKFFEKIRKYGHDSVQHKNELQIFSESSYKIKEIKYEFQQSSIIEDDDQIDSSCPILEFVVHDDIISEALLEIKTCETWKLSKDNFDLIFCFEICKREIIFISNTTQQKLIVAISKHEENCHGKHAQKLGKDLERMSLQMTDSCKRHHSISKIDLDNQFNFCDFFNKLSWSFANYDSKLFDRFEDLFEKRLKEIVDPSPVKQETTTKTSSTKSTQITKTVHIPTVTESEESKNTDRENSIFSKTPEQINSELQSELKATKLKIETLENELARKNKMIDTLLQ